MVDNLVARVSRYYKPGPSGLGLAHALYAEFLGTFLFQLVGGMAGTAVGNGLGLVITAFLTGNISGGYLNPALSVAHAISGEEVALAVAPHAAAPARVHSRMAPFPVQATCTGPWQASTSSPSWPVLRSGLWPR